MQRNAPNPGSYVFVSYLREDSEAVGRLCTELRSHGVDVWLDKDDIVPGSRWKQSIRIAIRQGSFFIACFSEAYDRRGRSYMNEELVEAIEVLRQQPEDRSWFIPVKLSACKIPNRSIGAGQTLDDLDYVDLHADWTAGVIRLLSVIQPHKKNSLKPFRSSSPCSTRRASSDRH